MKYIIYIVFIIIIAFVFYLPILLISNNWDRESNGWDKILEGLGNLFKID
jgi:hypothetical protein